MYNNNRLVDYLTLPDATSYLLKIQAATVLGSIAYGKKKFNKYKKITVLER